MVKDYFYLAITNLKHRGIRSWLTLLGIFIGVMAVVSLISLGAGLKAVVAAQFGISDTEVIAVQAGGISSAGPPGAGVTKKLTEYDADAIRKLSNVESVIPKIITAGKVVFNNVAYFGMVTSIPSGKDRKIGYKIIDVSPIKGRLLNDGDNDKVVLGWNFYKNNNIFGRVVVPGNTIKIQGKKFEVVGILKKKGSFMFDNIVLMNQKDIVDLFHYGKKLDLIAVKVNDKGSMNSVKLNIEKLMRNRRDVKSGKEDFSVSTPSAMLSSVNNILNGVQIFIIIIASISILVGAVGIVNTMATSVMERKKEIGIMKAVGAKNSQIFMEFLIESGLLGLVGGFVGIVFGVLIGIVGVFIMSNYIGTEVAPSINFVLIFGTLFGSFFIGAVSGIVPAMNAAKQNPVEDLRG